MFSNLIVGPAICSDKPLLAKEIKKDIEKEGLIVVAIVTNKKDPIFKMFDHQEIKAEIVFITIQYKKNYE